MKQLSFYRDSHIAAISALLFSFLFTLLAFGETLGLAVIQVPSVIVFLLFLASLILFTVNDLVKLHRSLKRTFIMYMIHFGLIFSILLRAFGPAIARLHPDKRFEVWDLDNLFFVSNARSISRFGNVENNLGIYGEPLKYHTAPAFLLASLQRVLGIDPLDAVFWLDGVFVALLLLLSLRYVKSLKVSSHLPGLAVLVALNLPFFRFKEDLRIFVRYIFDRPSFTYDTMFASIIGLTLLASYLVLKNERGQLMQLLTCLLISISLAETKPQYFPTFILLIAITLFFSSSTRKEKRLSVIRDTSIVLIVFVFWTILNKDNQISPVYTIIFPKMELSHFYRFAWSASSLFSILLISLMTFTSHYRLHNFASYRKSLVYVLLANTFFICSQIVLLVVKLEFPGTVWLDSDFEFSFERNDEQSLYPLQLLLLIFILWSLFSFIKRVHVLSLLFCIVSVVVSISVFMSHFTNPSALEDYANLDSTFDAIEFVPADSVGITNDFGFPPGIVQRPYSGYLSSVGGSQFYFTMPGNFHSAPSWSSKMTNSFLFFGSNLSLSHLRFLANNKISILVSSKRCTSPLISSLNDDFILLHENADFSIYEYVNSISQINHSGLPFSTPYVGQSSNSPVNSCIPPTKWTMPPSSRSLLGS